MKKTIILGIFTACALAGFASAATLAHRYSFSGDFSDSVGGNTGLAQNGATVTATSLSLTGLGSSTGGNHMSFSSPIDIGTSFGASGVTIETWYTDTGTGTWGKLFQFGDSAAGVEFGYTHTRGNGEQSGVDRNGAKLFNEQVTQNVEHHLVIAVAADGTMNTWVDDSQKLTGVATNAISGIPVGFEAIGATSWGDPGMNGTVNEFRIYSGELNASEVSTNFGLGPDAIPEPAGLALISIGALVMLRRRRR